MLATKTAVDLDLSAALETLPPEEATALLFAALPGITYREVAARLGEEPNVILRRLTSGLRALSRSAQEVPGQPLPEIDREVQ